MNFRRRGLVTGFLRDEVARWRDIIKTAGVKLE